MDQEIFHYIKEYEETNKCLDRKLCESNVDLLIQPHELHKFSMVSILKQDYIFSITFFSVTIMKLNYGRTALPWKIVFPLKGFNQGK